MARRQYSNIAVDTTLAAGINNSATTLDLADDSGWPAAPFTLVIEPGTANEELILVGSKSGVTLSSLTRGYGGTSAVSHSAGAEIKHVAVAEDFSFIWTHEHDGTDDSAAVSHDNLDGVSADDHHTEDHASRHALGGADPLTYGHGDLTGVSANDHHNEDHAARHLPAGADPLIHGDGHQEGGSDEIDEMAVTSQVSYTGTGSGVNQEIAIPHDNPRMLVVSKGSADVIALVFFFGNLTAMLEWTNGGLDTPQQATGISYAGVGLIEVTGQWNQDGINYQVRDFSEVVA